MHFFYTKFSYKIVVVSNFASSEVWMVNPENKTYNVIRLTINSIEQVVFEKNRIDETLQLLKKRMRISDISFLDVHVGHDEILDVEAYDSIAVDSDYYDGIDLNYAYPGIKNVVHEVADPNLEIRNLIEEMNKLVKNERKQQFKIKKPKMMVTYAVIALCIINFILSTFLQFKYNDVASMIVMGADYKMFTLGLNQFWRLLTHAFVHGDIFHLLCNMYSLYILGSILEEKIGSSKFAFILFSSVIAGGLLNGALSDNGVSVGISGGLFGLTAVYVILGYRNNIVSKSMIFQVLMINILISFMPNIGLFAHLGGLVTGVICYLIFFEYPNMKMYSIVLLVIFFLAFGYKYASNRTIRPIYGGTDSYVVDIYKDLGLDSYGNHLTERLYDAYQR